MDAKEARVLLDAARMHPNLIAQVVPSPMTLTVDGTVQQLIADGFLGELLSVDLRMWPKAFADYDSPLHWRQNRDISGYNIMQMGIWYEGIVRWTGPASKVMAMTKVYIQNRKDENGVVRAVTVPDHVNIMCEMANGAQAHLSFSSVTGHGRGIEVWLFGSEGTLRMEGPTPLTLYGGRRGDEQLSEIVIPLEKQGGWRVEEEFINAIRGKEPVTHTTFEEGVHYMEFTEAVTRSAQTGKAIALPL